MTGDWSNVDTWFGAFSVPCAKKWARGLVYSIFGGVPKHVVWYMLGVCSAEGEWGGRGIEDREVYAGDKVKDVTRLGEPPMWQTMLWVSKGGSPWKGQVGWDGVAYLS